MNQLSGFSTANLRLAPLARELIAQSARWHHCLTSQELRTLYGIFTTMLHDVHPNQSNMQTLETLVLRVPEGGTWWSRIVATCDNARAQIGDD